VAAACAAAGESPNVLKISVTPTDDITVNGAAVSLGQLDSILSKAATNGEEIWFHRLLNNKGSPASAKILKFAADNQIPIRFAAKSDFSDIGKAAEILSARTLVLFAPRPDYPQSAREHGTGGGGIFVQHVDRVTGSVTEVTVERSAGSQLLDSCAIEALRQWKYKAPAKTEKVKIPITFGARNGKVSY
jgi:TonB family protein